MYVYLQANPVTKPCNLSAKLFYFPDPDITKLSK